jgi:hypothetical protein
MPRIGGGWKAKRMPSWMPENFMFSSAVISSALRGAR